MPLKMRAGGCSIVVAVAPAKDDDQREFWPKTRQNTMVAGVTIGNLFIVHQQALEPVFAWQ
jgi:hypothetical protein